MFKTWNIRYGVLLYSYGGVRVNNKLLNQYLISLQNGNANALESIYNITRKAVFSVSLSVVKNPHDACDIMQSTYIKINDKIHLYKPNTNALAWILTITKNISINESKKLSRNLVSDFNEKEPVSEMAQYADIPIFNICKQVLNEEELCIILLHVVSGYKHREIAELINKPLGTVLWSYNNSLKKLRNNLEAESER